MCKIVSNAIIERPQISLFLLVLTFCALFLSGALIRLQIVDHILDPAMKSNSAKLLRTLSDLEFCSESWNKSSKLFALNEAFLLDLDTKDAPKKMFKRSIRVDLMTQKAAGSVHPIFTQMHGYHLGFTGADALAKINVTLLVPTPEKDSICKGKGCISETFKSCMVFSAPSQLLPDFPFEKPCRLAHLHQILSTKSAKMMWQKRNRLVGASLCQNHPTWTLKNSTNEMLLHITQDDIDLICVRIFAIIIALLVIIISISISVLIGVARSGRHAYTALSSSDKITSIDKSESSVTDSIEKEILPNILEKEDTLGKTRTRWRSGAMNANEKISTTTK